MDTGSLKETFKWIKYRLRILLFWLGGKRNNVSLVDLIRYLTRPSYSSLARKRIIAIEQDDNFKIISLRGIPGPLYYPRSFGMQSLFQVIGETLYTSNWHNYEIPGTQVSRDDVVVDCGAAEGLFSLNIVGRCRRVVIIEPMPAYHQSLHETFKPYQNVSIIRCALSDEQGSGYITDDEIRSELTLQKPGVETPITTLDDLFHKKRSPLSYIKADLEGYEMKMMGGAVETIREWKPKIAITTYHNKGDADRIRCFISKIVPGYRYKVKGIEGRAGDPVMLHAWYQP